MMGLVSDTTNLNLMLFPRYKEGTLGAVEGGAGGAGRGGGKKGGFGLWGRREKPHTAWLKVQLRGRGGGSGAGLPRVYDAQCRVTLKLGE
jgi:hypothetical protein